MQAVGFRIRSGVAIAVVIAGSPATWEVSLSRTVDLCPKEGKLARFPYHPLVELEGDAGAAASRKAVDAVRGVARRELQGLLSALGPLSVAGIVGGSLIDPASLPNVHMRAHALEGKLYREVVATALRAASIPAHVFSDRDLLVGLAKRLAISASELAALLTRAGRGRFR